jgi:hypothetical protein
MLGYDSAARGHWNKAEKPKAPKARLDERIWRLSG